MKLLIHDYVRAHRAPSNQYLNCKHNNKKWFGILFKSDFSTYSLTLFRLYPSLCRYINLSVNFTKIFVSVSFVFVECVMLYANALNISYCFDRFFCI